jgi:ABC-type amino acid transport substrate-binding protein
MAAVTFLLATTGVAAAQGVNYDQSRRTDGRSVISSRDQDLLDRVRCLGSLLVGVRGNYPGFGVRTEATFTGYDVAVAKLIGEELGLAVELVEVTSLNRIAKVASGSVDMVIATMAHTATRQIRFVRPHYYATYTVVVGEKTSDLRGE